MAWARHDYHPLDQGNGVVMQNWWDVHWQGQSQLRDNLEEEPVWPHIEGILHKPGIVLEAGCGIPHWVQFFHGRGHDCIGIDYAASCLRIGRRANPHLHLTQGDLRALPFASETFSCIVSFGAIEHDVRGPQVVLREFYRVLRPGGHLLCSVPCLNISRQICRPFFVLRDWFKTIEWLRRLAGKTEPFAFYEYLWSPEEYRGLLEDAGFCVNDVRPFAYRARRRLGRLWADSGPAGQRTISWMAWLVPYLTPHMMIGICMKPRAVN